MEDIFNNLYSNDEDNNRVDLKMNEVHCQTGKTRGCSRPSSSKEGGSNAKASLASESEEEQDATMGNTKEAPGSQDATMSNNEEAPGSTGGGGDTVSHVALAQGLAKSHAASNRDNTISGPSSHSQWIKGTCSGG
jgi:hypothetical protein